MPRAPTTPAEALGWIQEAVSQGKYTPEPHLYRRFRERNLNIWDVKRIVAMAICCEPYSPERGPKAGGTSWRITGPCLSGEEASVGAEAYYDTGHKRAVLITIF